MTHCVSEIKLFLLAKDTKQRTAKKEKKEKQENMKKKKKKKKIVNINLQLKHLITIIEKNDDPKNPSNCFLSATLCR